METPRKFKTSLFGYKKKFVNAYIMECAQAAEKTKTELEKKNCELEKDNKALTEKIAVLEKERAYIADALLNAKLEAEKMLEEARLETSKMRSGLELELEELRAKIRGEKDRILEIRQDAKNTLAEYIGRLDDINIKAEPEEEESEETAKPEESDEPVADEPVTEDSDDDEDDDI